MRYVLTLAIVFSLLAFSCKEEDLIDLQEDTSETVSEMPDSEATEDDNSEVDQEETNEEEEDDSAHNEEGNNRELRTFIFGHSLIVHDPPAIAPPSDETTVPHWMADFANASEGNTLAVSGQYGFLTTHRNLPPISQWGFDIVTPAWDSDTEAFAEANFNSILFTAANFIQEQAPTDNYYNEPYSPVQATLEILDWCNNQNSDMDFYIYENWPDMAAFINDGAFPPNTSELEAYHQFTQEEFHRWWLTYHDELQAQRPNYTLKMIPVGPIISKLLSETPLQNIPITELYEDDAPHGRPTLYFLAGLITYMGMYQQLPPEGYQIPNTVDEIVVTHYPEVVNIIWTELQAFVDANGESRVF